MSTEFYNTQWQMPNEANKSKSSNYSLSFDGTNQVLGSGMNFLSGATTFSMAAWINLDSLSSSGTYMGVQKTSGNEISIKFDHSSGEFDFTVNSNQATAGVGSVEVVSSSKITANTWHHVVMVYDGSATGNANRLTVFIDGSPQTLTFTGTIPSSISTLMSSRAFCVGGNGGEMNGIKKMSDACLFDYALSSSQVTTLYGTGSAIGDPMALTPAPKAYYKLSDSVWNGSSYITPNSAVQDYVFDFSGTNDRVYGPTGVFSGQTATTISFWVNADVLDASSGVQNLFANGSYPYFRLNNTNINTTWPVSGNNFQSFASGMTAGKWHLFVFKWQSGSKYQIYIDNDLKGESTSTITGSFLSSNTSSLELANGVDNQDLQGKMSNFKVWDVALTTSELTTLYNNGSPIRNLASIPQNSNLKVWYKLDASEIYDSSNTQWQIANNVLSDKAYSFNGTNNIEITQNSSIQTSNFSIGFWIKGFPQDNKIIIENGGANGFSILTQSDGRIKCKVGSGVPGKTIPGALNGEWVFVWFTFAGIVRNSLNGSYYSGGSGGPSTPSYDSTKGLFIGSDSSSSNGFVGEIAQVVYYDKRGPNNAGALYGNLPANPPPNPLVGEANPNLVSWWKLDAATITDSQGSNNGTNNGATLIDTNVGRPAGIGGLSSGMSQSNLVQSDLSRVFNDNTLSLSGATARYAQTGSGFYPSSGNFTFSVWLRNTSSNRGGIFSKGSSFQASEFGLAIAGGGGDFTTGGSADNGKLIFMFDTAVAPSSTYLATSEVLESGKWYNFVATYTPGDLKLYLNGSLDNSTTSITKNTFSDQRPVLNAALVNGWNFSGQANNWAFFDTVLSATEVREIWNNGLPGDLKSHSKAANLKNWVKGAKGAGNQVLMDHVAPIGFTGSYMIGPPISSGLTDFQGSTSGFNAPSTTVTNITTDAPYSDKNAVSVNMQPTNSGALSNQWTTPTSGRTTETPQAT
tara:strand:+ start:6311 stop:9220 length:2910 start_codon:yes stop_codon:yes gene_type:complete